MLPQAALGIHSDGVSHAERPRQEPDRQSSGQPEEIKI
jgi:hypothetical protein